MKPSPKNLHLGRVGPPVCQALSGQGQSQENRISGQNWMRRNQKCCDGSQASPGRMDGSPGEQKWVFSCWALSTITGFPLGKHPGGHWHPNLQLSTFSSIQRNMQQKVLASVRFAFSAAAGSTATLSPAAHRRVWL